MENLVTTASRTPVARAHVGSAVSVVKRDAIEQRQSLLISDILQDLPGVAVNRAGGPGQQTQIRVRGAEANQLLVFIDGVEANDPAVGDEFSFEQLTAWDIERVELVRGPQSALWGSDALSGVLNITTRRGDQRLRGDVQAEAGQFSSSNLAGRIGGTTGRWSTDLSVSQYATDGINVSARVDENDGFSGERNDGYENTTASLTSEFLATDRLRLGLFARHTDSSSDFDAIGPDSAPVDADLRSDVQLGFLRANLDYAMLNQRWRHSLRARYHDSDRENLADGIVSDTQAGKKFGGAYQTSYDFSPSGSYRGIFAVDYEREEFRQRYLGFQGADQDQARDTLGYVAELLARPVEALDISASVRYDVHSDISNKASYRLTGSYLFQSTGSRVHSSLGTGLKQPTFTELFGFFPLGFAGNPNLRPEQSTGFDIGLDQSFMDNRIRLDMTLFFVELEDEIQGSGLSVINSPGISRRSGLEVDLRAELMAGLDATATYTYTDATEPNPDDPSLGRRDEVRRPNNMGSVNLNYRFADRRANLNLNVSYTDKQTDDIFPAPDYIREQVTLSAYTLVNLAASYTLTDNLTLYARAENLFDEDYQSVYGYRSPGAAYYAGLRMKFAN